MKNQDISGRCCRPGGARPAISTLRFGNYPGTGRKRLRGRRVRAAIVYHNAFADELPGHFLNHSRDILRFVQCGNDNRNCCQIRGSSEARNWNRQEAVAGSATSGRNAWVFFSIPDFAHGLLGGVT